MSYIIKVPLVTGTEVTEHTCEIARAMLSIELGRPVEDVTYRGSTIVDQEPLVEWHTFRETSR